MAEMESSPKPQLKAFDQEEAQPKGGSKKQGGWITLPFIAGCMIGLGLAINGTSSNLQIYLIKQYNVESIDAAQIGNIVRGSLNFLPLAGAILSDSFFGYFPVILAGAATNVLAFVLFTLTAALPSLRPPHCPAPSDPSCQHGTPGQFAVLYSAIFLLAIGTGGTRFNVATMGADQFKSTRDQDTFFNWYFVFLYTSYLVGDTAIVYVQDGVSWSLGFGVCLATTAFSFAMLLAGARYYRPPAPKGSPYSELARVIVAAVRKGRANVGGARYYVGDDAVAGEGTPSKRLRFLNRAAMITESDKFSRCRDQDTFFNWYFVFLYTSYLVGDTAIVYVQDGVSWALGFGVCLVTTAFSFVMLLAGARYYRAPSPRGSPYTELARVVVAAVRKGRANVGGARYHGFQIQ